MAKGSIGRPLQPPAQKKITQPSPKGPNGSPIQQKSQGIAQQNALNRMGMGGKSQANGAPNPASAAKQAVSEVGNELATNGASYLALSISLATFNLLASAGTLFLLWVGCIGQALFSAAKQKMPKIVPVIILLLFTGIFIAEIGLIIVIIIFIISLIEKALNLFPPPLDFIYKSFIKL